MTVIHQTRAQQVAAIRKDVPAGIIAALEAHERADAEIDEKDEFKEEHRRNLRVTLERDTRTKVDLLTSAILADVSKEFDAREGEARAAAKDQLSFPLAENADALMRRLITEVRAERRLLDVTLQLQELPGLAVDGLALAFENVLLTDDATAIRRVGAAVVGRLEQLAAAVRRKAAKQHPAPSGDTDDVITLATTVSERFAAWRKDHPTPIEQLRANDSARRAKVFAVQHDIEAAITFVLR